MKPFRGLVKSYYTISTYIKTEVVENLSSHRLQELGRQAIEKVMNMKEEDIIAVPEEKVNAYLEDTTRRIIYADREIHEKWLKFPKQLKKWLHYWTNVKLLELLNEIPKEPQQKEKNRENELVFYLFGKIGRLYKQGFLNGELVLSVLEELYEKQNEIQPIRKKDYAQLEKQLGGAVKVLVNFKNHPDLRDWYLDLPLERKRGLWVKAHKELLDKLEEVWYNIIHQTQ
jgi:hypothetical protein